MKLENLRNSVKFKVAPYSIENVRVFETHWVAKKFVLTTF